MTAATVSEDEFLRIWKATGGSAKAVAKRLGIAERAVHSRRKRLEEKHDAPILSTSKLSTRYSPSLDVRATRIDLQIQDGTMIVGSDAHRWNEPLTTAQRAFVNAAKDLKPSHVVLNGDVFDGAKISRHDRIGWDKRPSVTDELEGCKQFTEAVQDAAGGAKKIWTLGNHCQRFSTRLASTVPEYEGVPGFALKDHFPAWIFAMAIFVNDDVVIKHRMRNGVAAKRGNTVHAGRTTVTGHLHSLGATEFTDYNGTRYGIDTGTLADPWGDQFDYLEMGPRDWRSGFAVLTWNGGKLMRPEFVQVWDDNSVQFRGKIWSV